VDEPLVLLVVGLVEVLDVLGVEVLVELSLADGVDG
jgi:hypothetical protein